MIPYMFSNVGMSDFPKGSWTEGSRKQKKKEILIKMFGHFPHERAGSAHLALPKPFIFPSSYP